nr:hypothetical protein [Candidatus Woesebacteria bacterium]
QGTPNTINGKPVIRVVNFNPGPGHAGNREVRAIVWKDLAKYLSDQNADVIMIQEPGKSELNTIRTVFEKYFPYSTWIRYPEGITDPEDIKRGGELNPIFSKYPFIEGSQQEWLISQNHDGNNKGRVVLSKNIQTPYGVFRVVNFHTHGDTQCEDAYYAFKPITEPASPFYNPPGQNFIIAGDYNIALSSATLFDPNKRNSGGIFNKSVCSSGGVDRGIKYADELAEIIRLNYKTHCLDSNRCANTGKIEMIWSLHTSPTELYKMWWGDDHFRHAFQDANKHPVVFADVGDPKWKLPASAPSTKPGDLDANSVVDIFDYNLLLGKFGASGTAGFHAADIIQNGVVDIFDYNKLIEGFGK